MREALEHPQVKARDTLLTQQRPELTVETLAPVVKLSRTRPTSACRPALGEHTKGDPGPVMIRPHAPHVRDVSGDSLEPLRGTMCRATAPAVGPGAMKKAGPERGKRCSLRSAPRPRRARSPAAAPASAAASRSRSRRTGATVAITSRKMEHLPDPTVAEFARPGRRAIAKAADVRDPAAVTDVVNVHGGELGRLDISQRRAGISSAPPSPRICRPNGFGTVVDIDLKGDVPRVESGAAASESAWRVDRQHQPTLPYLGTMGQSHAAAAKARDPIR